MAAHVERLALHSGGSTTHALVAAGRNRARAKQGMVSYLRAANPGTLLTVPGIYSLLLPLALLDLWVTVYQSLCFRAYNIAPVRRTAYLVVDRHRLAYLNGIERLNCTFCSYANGVLAYAREVAARTEEYWCPIKHSRRLAAPHDRYRTFVAFGDARGYHDGLRSRRRGLRRTRGPQRRFGTGGSGSMQVRPKKALLFCGIASSLLYAFMIWAIRYPGYSPLSQVPSELTAIAAPTRALWTWLGSIYTLLVAAFGWGIRQSAGRDRRLRLVGALILAHASLGLLWPFAPMHQRAVLAAGGATLSDTLHVALGAVTVVLMFLAIGFGASAFGPRFRFYSIASIVVLLAFGGLTFLEAPALQANLPTPWIGLWERINISVFLLWIVVLALCFFRDRSSRRCRATLR